MTTNPRAFDARAAIGLKVADRTVMLDNPVGQKAGQARKAGPGSRWAAQLASKSTQRRLGLYQLRAAGLTWVLQGWQGARGSRRTSRRYSTAGRSSNYGLHREACLQAASCYFAPRVPSTPSCRAGCCPHCGLCVLSRRYEAVQPLHASWQQYMRELLAWGGGPGAADVEARLFAADLHGCLIRVVQTAGENKNAMQRDRPTMPPLLRAAALRAAWCMHAVSSRAFGCEDKLRAQQGEQPGVQAHAHVQGLCFKDTAA